LKEQRAKLTNAFRSVNKKKFKENFRPAARPRMKGAATRRARSPLGADNRPQAEKQILENRPRRLLATEMLAQAVHVLFAALA
jgi:hypothetical protein